MIRTVAMKALLASAVLTMGAVTVNCSSKNTSDSDQVGKVSLELTLPNGKQLNTVTYEVKNAAGVVVRSGSIDVSGSSAKPSVLLSGLTPGHYTAKMDGKSVDMTTTCSGSAGFDVALGLTTTVNVLLQCREAGTTGDAVINGMFNTCPVIDSTAVTPLATNVGKTIDLQGMAHDPDCLTLSGTICTAFEPFVAGWTATGGTIAPAGSANATFTCTTGGTFDLTLTASDKNADGTLKCSTTAKVTVNCVATSCGNNIKEPAFGEECDGTDKLPGQVCDANCHVVPQCGNGIKEGTEQCDPPGQNNTCDASCKTIAIVCGNGLIQPGEQCDPPAAGTCSATCQTLAPTCGDGVVNQASEECDLGTQNGVAGSGCSSTCKNVPTCSACEVAGQTLPASASSCNPMISGCSMITVAADKTLCENLVACVRSTGCAVDATGDGQPCYCGTASDNACLSSGLVCDGGTNDGSDCTMDSECPGGFCRNANGACKAQAVAAAKSSTPINVANRFVDPNFPIGRAFNLLKCDVAAGCGPTGNGVCPL